MTRYHPALVALHWILAMLIIVALMTGGLVLSETPNDDPSKLFGLRVHMTMGLIILALMLLRLVVRVLKPTPPHADIGHPALNRLGVATHWLFYVLVVLVAGSGIAISVTAGLPDIVFAGSGAPLPEDFSAYPARAAHGLFTMLLGLLVLGHVAAFGWHQWVRKDGLLRRMSFGRRTG